VSVKHVPCDRVESDEIWCFAYPKDKNLPKEMRGMPGSYNKREKPISN